MAKQTVKSKAVVGSTKKQKGLKLSGRTVLFGLVGVMAFSILAGLGWQKWQDHKLTASAYNYTNLPITNQTPTLPGAYLKACKRLVSSGDYEVYVLGQKSMTDASYGSAKLKYVSATFFEDLTSKNGGYKYLIGLSYPMSSTGYAYVRGYMKPNWVLQAALVENSSDFNFVASPPRGAVGNTGRNMSANYIKVTNLVNCD